MSEASELDEWMEIVVGGGNGSHLYNSEAH